MRNVYFQRAWQGTVSNHLLNSQSKTKILSQIVNAFQITFSNKCLDGPRTYETREGACFVCASMINNRSEIAGAHTKTCARACFVCASLTNNRTGIASAHTKTCARACFVCASMINNRSGIAGAHTKTRASACFVCASMIR